MPAGEPVDPFAKVGPHRPGLGRVDAPPRRERRLELMLIKRLVQLLAELLDLQAEHHRPADARGQS
jgi:hypothetical protein